ncbi:MAG: thioredoxin family protein [bacterium]|nr:thioredoxin family protein [bacterium]
MNLRRLIVFLLLVTSWYLIIAADKQIKILPKPQVTFIELGSVKCVPCKMMQPIIEDIKMEYQGQVEVIFYDVWTKAGRPYGEKYKIQAIPTQIFLDKTGKEYFRHIGFFPKEELVKVLKQQGVK